MKAYCPACDHRVELEVVHLDSSSRCPRCGRAELEPVSERNRQGAEPAIDREEFGHRLRTPLTVVKGSLQHLVKHWDDLGDRDKKVLVKAVLAQADVAIDAVGTLEDRMSAGTPRSQAEIEETERA